MKIFFLVLIGINTLNSFSLTRFNANNGVISDSATNLKWQDSYSDNNNNVKYTTWKNGINYCENLNLNGQRDWRLPNIVELTSLVDDRIHNPVINAVFQNTSLNDYWSSTTNSNINDYAKVLSFQSGSMGNYSKSYTHYIRCVRDGVTPIFDGV